MHSSSTPGRAKGSRLVGGAVTEEALDSSASVLERRGARARAGLQQFFSTPEAAALACRVITGGQAPSGYGPFVLDPTAGDGALMAAWPRERRFGVEIDPGQVDAGDYTALRGDLQRLYPLMRLAGVRFPAVVCNPPFGLDWQDPASGRTVKLDGALPALRARAARRPRPGAPDRWARPLSPRDRAAARGARRLVHDRLRGPLRGRRPAGDRRVLRPGRQPPRRETLRLGGERTGLADLARQVIQWRGESCGQVNCFSYEDGSDLREAFTSVQREHDRRRDQRGTERRYDVELRGRRLRCHPSAFAKLALAERGLLRQVQGLNGKAIRI